MQSSSAAAPKQRAPRVVRVWDLPTRLMHWSLAISVIGALVCLEVGGDAMAWHMRFGYAALAIIPARVAWGFLGPRYARFRSFPPNPVRAFRYLRAGAHGAFAGHNPAGALSVYAMLLCVAFQAFTGLFTNDDVLWSGPYAALVSGRIESLATSLHHLNGNFVYLLVGLHLAAIVFHSRFRREPLVAAMIHGDRAMPHDNGDAPALDGLRHRLVGLALLGASAFAVWALVSWPG